MQISSDEPYSVFYNDVLTYEQHSNQQMAGSAGQLILRAMRPSSGHDTEQMNK